MTEVHRYKAIKMLSEAGNLISYEPHGPYVVMAEAYDKLKAENERFDEGMRSIASSLGAGGYNAKHLSAAELLDKVRWGLDHLCDTNERRITELKAENEALRKDAERYRVLRQADVDTIHNGGLFAGLTPDNIVINGHDLDRRTDAVIAAHKEVQP